MADDAARQWLDHLARHGDQVVGDLYAYDRLAPDWAVAFPHGLPEHLVYLLVAGSASGSVQRDTVSLSAGSLLWLPPRTAFELHAVGAVEPMLYRFRLATGDVPYPPDYVLLHDAWSARATMDAIVAELGSSLDFRTERLRALLVLLFSTLFRSARPGGRIAPLPESTRSRLEAYADARLGERPTVGELAAVAELSDDYFARRFRETFGLAPKSWLVRRRMHHAMLRLDESTEPVSTIAHRLGYADGFLFSRQFKAATGVSPRAWRSRGRR